MFIDKYITSTQYLGFTANIVSNGYVVNGINKSAVKSMLDEMKLKELMNIISKHNQDLRVTVNAIDNIKSTQDSGGIYNSAEDDKYGAYVKKMNGDTHVVCDKDLAFQNLLSNLENVMTLQMEESSLFDVVFQKYFSDFELSQTTITQLISMMYNANNAVSRNVSA